MLMMKSSFQRVLKNSYGSEVISLVFWTDEMNVVSRQVLIYLFTFLLFPGFYKEVYKYLNCVQAKYENKVQAYLR